MTKDQSFLKSRRDDPVDDWSELAEYEERRERARRYLEGKGRDPNYGPGSWVGLALVLVILVWVALAVVVLAQTPPLFTTCEETEDGRVAMVLPPELKGNQVLINQAARHCRDTLNLREALGGMSLPKDKGGKMSSEFFD